MWGRNDNNITQVLHVRKITKVHGTEKKKHYLTAGLIKCVNKKRAVID